MTDLSFCCAVDKPERFKKSADVAAYFGLTPCQFQSGVMPITLRVSQNGVIRLFAEPCLLRQR